MSDRIEGPVFEVLDGNTFSIKVKAVYNPSGKEYNNSEIVQISGIVVPEVYTEESENAKKELADKLSGKRVVVNVESRDPYGRVVGTYEVIK